MSVRACIMGVCVSACVHAYVSVLMCVRVYVCE